MKQRPICEDDLHAWADGRLDAARRAEVEAWLAEDPARAARVMSWRTDTESLRVAYDRLLDEPVPARLRATVERIRPQRSWRAAAALAWLTLGALAGAGGGYRLGLDASDGAGLGELPRRAAVAHAVYSPEVRHPVEVGADQEQHLVAWLSKRLGGELRIPELSSHGFGLLGGRLLPAADGAGAQFMYEDDAGRRLTLYVTVRSTNTPTTAFRFAQENGLGVFYWIDTGFAYALSGAFDRSVLLPIANDVHQQLVR